MPARSGWNRMGSGLLQPRVYVNKKRFLNKSENTLHSSCLSRPSAIHLILPFPLFLSFLLSLFPAHLLLPTSPPPLSLLPLLSSQLPLHTHQTFRLPTDERG